jgi:uncharacterized protein (TIGR02271 family)
MSRTVTALYDSRAEAEEARARLSSEVNADVEIIDQSTQSGGRGTQDYDISEDDRHAYGEGLRRGGYLLCARVETGESADRIVSILEESTSVDLDERQQSWRNDGWAPHGQRTGEAISATTAQAQQTVEEERIPVIEEQLRVGKREVARGGARVRSYVREVPVHEQVQLREEHVSIERRPVEERISEADLESGGILRERVVEVSELKEEPVVSKEAVIREELVVKKTVEQHSEQIDESVRRTEVEIQDLSGSGERSAFGGFEGDNARAPQGRGSEYERSDKQG